MGDVSVTLVVMLVLAAALGGYIVTSLVLLKFPSLLHQKKKARFRATHISHMGGAGENLENTLAAFEHAVAVGSEMLEMDCHITKDGMVVISHDSTLLRTTGHSVSILETDYKDLPRLKERLRPSFAQDHETVGGEDRQIPLLRDIFIKFPDTPINIDIKIDDDELIQKVGELVAEFGREPITVWGSRSMAVINKCYATNPAIPVFFCIQRVVALLLLYYSGLLPFVPLRESFYEVLMPSIALRQGKMAMTLNTRYRLLVRLADCLMMRKSLIKHLTDRGVQVYLWVLNEEEDWHRAFQLGASGVMTDFPTRLSRFLEAHPHYMSRPEP